MLMSTFLWVCSSTDVTQRVVEGCGFGGLSVSWVWRERLESCSGYEAESTLTDSRSSGINHPSSLFPSILYFSHPCIYSLLYPSIHPTIHHTLGVYCKVLVSDSIQEVPDVLSRIGFYWPTKHLQVSHAMTSSP